MVTTLLVLQSAIPLNKSSVRAAPLRTITGGCGIEVSYTGMDTTHVIYDSTGCSQTAGATSVDLRVTVNSATTTLIPGITNGKYRHISLPLYADVNYFFRFNYPGGVTDTLGFLTGSTTVGSMGGTLLFGEVVTIPAVSQTTWVVIPSEITLELDYGTYDATSVAQFEVQTGGKLILDHMETNGGYFKSPETPQGALTIRFSQFLTFGSHSGGTADDLLLNDEMCHFNDCSMM